MEEKQTNEISELDITLEGKILIDKSGNKYRYVDPMTDKGFKILFGSEGNEELLINLLNGITGTELETLYSKGEIAALPKSKKLNYISYIMSRNDELNSRAEQIADAREEGRVEGREEIIRCMVASGMAAEEIARIVKMDIKDVENVLRG